MALAGPGAAAAGLSVGNLVIGNATNAMQAQYVTETFNVMETAIRKYRANQEAAIEARLNATLKPTATPPASAQPPSSPSAKPYEDLSDALLDWQEYDRSCSLQNGLILVSDAVQKQVTTPTPTPTAASDAAPAHKPSKLAPANAEASHGH